MQGSITRIATAEREKEDLAAIKAKQVRLSALQAAQCVISPVAMDNFLSGMLSLVDETIARSKIGVPPTISVNGRCV